MIRFIIEPLDSSTKLLYNFSKHDVIIKLPGCCLDDGQLFRMIKESSKFFNKFRNFQNAIMMMNQKYNLREKLRLDDAQNVEVLESFLFY